MARRASRILLAIWTVFILWVCWLPKSKVPNPPTGHEIPHLDKAVHFTLFAVFGALGMLSGVNRDRGLAVRVCGAALALTVLTEAGQALEIVGRTPDVIDGLCDMSGAAFGALWVGIAERRRLARLAET